MATRLGDLLLQVVLHSEIEEEAGKFSLEDVALFALGHDLPLRKLELVDEGASVELGIEEQLFPEDVLAAIELVDDAAFDHTDAHNTGWVLRGDACHSW